MRSYEAIADLHQISLGWSQSGSTQAKTLSILGSEKFGSRAKTYRRLYLDLEFAFAVIVI